MLMMSADDQFATGSLNKVGFMIHRAEISTLEIYFDPL